MVASKKKIKGKNENKKIQGISHTWYGKKCYLRLNILNKNVKISPWIYKFISKEY